MKTRAGVIAVALLLAGCTTAPEPTPTPTASAPPSPTPTATATPEAIAPVQPTGDVAAVIQGLDAPWSVVRLESGSTLISERDTALVKEVQADGTVRSIGTIPNVVPGGEGGLLGIEVVDSSLYAYFTAANDNRILRFDLVGGPGSYSIGGSSDILIALVKAGNHNGGRIKLGPDGKLYATVGDASQPGLAQDPSSYNGKILRMNPDGSAPADNPTPGSLVYSLGHRNPQGITWDAEGRLWAAEFGQNTWDELNLIQPGGNYGWPIVEGQSSNTDYINPVYQWSTDAASPSGLVAVGNTLFMAGLGGERLWAIYPDASGTTATATEWFAGAFGRIRDVVEGPDGSVWMMTNNTDGRGSPRAGDDQLLQVSVAPLG